MRQEPLWSSPVSEPLNINQLKGSVGTAAGASPDNKRHKAGRAPSTPSPESVDRPVGHLEHEMYHKYIDFHIPMTALNHGLFLESK